MITFKLIDKETGCEFYDDKIEKFAKENGLMKMHIDQFAVTEDGHIVLLDDCGRFAYFTEDAIIKIEIDTED